MSDEIVPANDFPDEEVPEHDLPVAGKTIDPRDLVPRSLGAGAGAVTGAVVAPVVQSGVNAVQQSRLAPPPSMGAPHPSQITPGHTPFNPTGRTVEDSLENWKSYNEAQLEASKKIRQESKLHKKYPGFTRAAPELEIPRLPENATIGQRIGQKMWPTAASDIGNFVRGVSEYKLPFIGKVGPLAGHLLGGAAAGSQYVDAYNRGEQGDTTGAIISGIGGTGTAASVLPLPPVARGIGAGVGLSAEAINAYRDAMREGRIEHGAPEHPENVTSLGNPYAAGGLVHLAEGGDPPKPNANEASAFVGYPQINKNRKIGSGTGFLDAALGAPPMEGTILNPSHYSYMQGYEKGEPYGIASMALPFAGAVAKPLAREIGTRAFMGESLVPKALRGLMPEQPVSQLTAFHGTPAGPFNKFEKEFIGEGEGHQAYGHGMYFAENPNIAKEYQKNLAGYAYNPQDLVDYWKPESIRKSYGGYDKVIAYDPAKNHVTVQSVVKDSSGNWIPDRLYGSPRIHATHPDPKEFKNVVGRDLPFAGSLYKVDIPDEHISKMLDWDLPLSQQHPSIHAAIEKNMPDLYGHFLVPNTKSGEWLHNQLDYKLGGQKEAAEYLNSIGIPGIKYNDSMSRNPMSPAYGGKPTKNFVSFQPEEVKILERNGEPVGPLSTLDKEQ